ncbi:hypothetical protein Skr01_25460 [Sphaerisporangium krabiense]|nr:hypothetical protein Skr01_25460 [Sphaerisporangium krabiense]
MDVEEPAWSGKSRQFRQQGREDGWATRRRQKIALGSAGEGCSERPRIGDVTVTAHVIALLAGSMGGDGRCGERPRIGDVTVTAHVIGLFAARMGGDGRGSRAGDRRLLGARLNAYGIGTTCPIDGHSTGRRTAIEQSLSRHTAADHTVTRQALSRHTATGYTVTRQTLSRHTAIDRTVTGQSSSGQFSGDHTATGYTADR